MSKLIVPFLTINFVCLGIGAEMVSAQTSSRRIAMKPSAVSQQTQESPAPTTVQHRKQTETTTQDNQQLGVELSTTTVQSPHDLLSMSTSLRTPVPTKTDETTPAARGAPRITKQIDLQSDRFAHKTILFEEPIHERHGIANRPLQQVTKSTVVFFGRSILLPGTLITKRHLNCDSGEGWRDSQGNRVCIPK